MRDTIGGRPPSLAPRSIFASGQARSPSCLGLTRRHRGKKHPRPNFSQKSTSRRNQRVNDIGRMVYSVFLLLLQIKLRTHEVRCERRYEVTKHILSLRMNELVARGYTTTNDDSVVICSGFFIVTQGKYTYTDF